MPYFIGLNSRIDLQVDQRSVSEDRTEQCGKMPKTAAPQHDVNFDEIGHWPQCVQKKAGTEYER